MRLFEYRTIHDFGVEHQFLFVRGRRTLLQLSLSLDDAPYYHFQLTSSFVSPLSLFVCLWRLSLSADVLSTNWEQGTDDDLTDTDTDLTDEHQA
jgi:hypothetical protein